MQPTLSERERPSVDLHDHPLLRAHLRRHFEGAARAAGEPGWNLAEVAGRLVELSGQRASALLSLALRLVLDAQRRGEHAAWVTGRASSFYPPDAHELGVDLEALIVVRVERAGDVAAAAEWLARSGAFGLVVLDLTAASTVSMALQSRLLAQAQKHDLGVLCLTEKPAASASLSSLVSLRAEARLRRRTEPEQFFLAAAGATKSTEVRSAARRNCSGTVLFNCELAVLKDKRRSRPWSHVEVARGTPGMR
jgi:recombination protein RecA